jgi:peroxiredoxin
MCLVIADDGVARKQLRPVLREKAWGNRNWVVRIRLIKDDSCTFRREVNMNMLDRSIITVRAHSS